jgi:DNA-binding response OmpR family regulator
MQPPRSAAMIKSAASAVAITAPAHQATAWRLVDRFGGWPDRMGLICLLEDEERVALDVCTSLRARGHVVEWFDAPHRLFYRLGRRSADCVVVDWVLPEMSGLDVVARLRQTMGRQVGVLMVTAMDSEECIVSALRSGADDYVVKPSSGAILAARVDAVLRRVQSSPSSHDSIVVGPYSFEFVSQCAALHGAPLDLMPREFDLAWTLFAQPGRLLTKESLQAAIWGKRGGFTDHTLAQHVYALRKKLQLAQNGARLVAVYAVGYRLELPAAWPMPGGNAA